MNFIIAYFKGYFHLFRSWKIWSIHYLLLLLLALLAALPFLDFMDLQMGHSLEIEKLLPGFDYTVYQDFINYYGVRDALAFFINLNQWLLMLFVLLSVFLTGGVLHLYKNYPENYSLRSFFSGCTYYFWRMLRLTVYFLIIHVAVGALFGFVYYLLIKGGFAELGSEVGYLERLKWVVIGYLFFAAIFFMIHDYAKIHLVHQDKTFLFRTFWQSFPLVFRNFFNIFLLYLLNLLTFVGIFVAYWYFSRQIATDNTQGIALAFGLGQGFILARIGCRLLNLASATLVYKGIQKKRFDRETRAQQAREELAAANAEAARLAEEALQAEQKAEAAALAAAAGLANFNTTIESDASHFTETSAENIAGDIPPTEPDHTKVVRPPDSHVDDLFGEEE